MLLCPNVRVQLELFWAAGFLRALRARSGQVVALKLDSCTTKKLDCMEAVGWT